MSDEIAGRSPDGGLFREIGAATREKAYRFRPLRLLTGAVLVAGGAHLLLLVAIVPAAAVAPHLTAICRTWSLVTLIATYLLSSFWIYFAACNIRALGARGMQVSPGMAVGWFAVPIASLFMPFQAMREIYQASLAPTDWIKRSTPLLLRVWWGSWLAAGIGSAFVSILSRAGSDRETMLFTGWVALGMFAVDLVACGCFLAIVSRIHRAQARSYSNASKVAQAFA